MEEQTSSLHTATTEEGPTKKAPKLSKIDIVAAPKFDVSNFHADDLKADLGLFCRQVGLLFGVNQNVVYTGKDAGGIGVNIANYATGHVIASQDQITRRHLGTLGALNDETIEQLYNNLVNHQKNFTGSSSLEFASAMEAVELFFMVDYLQNFPSIPALILAFKSAYKRLITVEPSVDVPVVARSRIVHFLEVLSEVWDIPNFSTLIVDVKLHNPPYDKYDATQILNRFVAVASITPRRVPAASMVTSSESMLSMQQQLNQLQVSLAALQTPSTTTPPPTNTNNSSKKKNKNSNNNNNGNHIQLVVVVKPLM
jgi:hypothetical protein